MEKYLRTVQVLRNRRIFFGLRRNKSQNQFQISRHLIACRILCPLISSFCMFLSRYCHSLASAMKYPHLVFVYGTLKRGEPNHFWLQDESHGAQDFYGTAETANKFPLVIASEYNIPFLLNSPGKGKKVKGIQRTVNNSLGVDRVVTRLITPIL